VTGSGAYEIARRLTASLYARTGLTNDGTRLAMMLARKLRRVEAAFEELPLESPSPQDGHTPVVERAPTYPKLGLAANL